MSYDPASFLPTAVVCYAIAHNRTMDLAMALYSTMGDEATAVDLIVLDNAANRSASFLGVVVSLRTADLDPMNGVATAMMALAESASFND